MSQSVINELVIYPVKSLQGISVKEAEVTEQGLKWDRFWMIVNEDGQFATQRHFAKMATIKTELTDTHLVLSHPEHDHCLIDLKPSAEVLEQTKSVKVWKSECLALDEGEKAAQWLTKVLGQWRGQNLSLVRMAPSFEREVSDSHVNGERNTTLFSDGYPFLITTTLSLQALNDQLEKQSESAIPMSRFRANIVIENNGQDNGAFIENRSDVLTIEKTNVDLHLCKPCERCKVPSIDQITGIAQSPQQPLKTLFSMDHVKQKGAFFGHNAVLSPQTKLLLGNQPVVIKVGDKVHFSN